MHRVPAVFLGVALVFALPSVALSGHHARGWHGGHSGQHHGWHGGGHHDWHRGFHRGPDWGWHGGRHHGWHRGHHHDWHGTWQHGPRFHGFGHFAPFGHFVPFGSFIPFGGGPIIIHEPFFCFPHSIGFIGEAVFFDHLHHVHGLAFDTIPTVIVHTGPRSIFFGW